MRHVYKRKIPLVLQIDLFSPHFTNGQITQSEVRDLALAYMSRGIQTRHTESVKQALWLFKKLHKSASERAQKR